jgi:curved DNA-binding protein
MNWQNSAFITSGNLYERLQVSPSVSAHDLRRAFRRLAKLHHPDLAPDLSHENRNFHSLREAYETLSNPVKRRIYDERLAHGKGLRARSYTASARAKSPFAYRSGRARVNFNASQFIHFADFDVTVTIRVPWSKGLSGGVQHVSLVKSPKGLFPLRADFVVVRLPQACPHGQCIRIPFYGRVDKSALRAGHLNVRVEYQLNATFKRNGIDVHTVFEVPPWDAALGGEFSLRSPAGPVRFELPSGVRHWQSIRVKGEGLPHASGRRGDLVICVKILPVAPTSAEQKRLWAALKQAHE